MPNPRQQKIAIETCLVGQVFYISSNAYKADHVTKNIVLLGGRTELFFSKNITSLLVDDYYVDQFKIHCQELSRNGISLPNGKSLVPVGVSNYRSLINQELLHLGVPVPVELRSAVARMNAVPTGELVTDVPKCMYSGNHSKVGEYSKFSALTQHHALEKPIEKFAICTPDQVLHPYSLTEAGELKKIAMLTASAGKGGEYSAITPSIRPSKCISLSTVHTFNHGLAVGPVSSHDYSYQGAKEKPNKTAYNHAVFQLMKKAYQWGIAITGICQFMKTVELYLSADFNKPKRRPRASNKIILSGCFLKVEDAARKYKAFYKVLKEDPIKYLPLQNRFISKQVEKYGSAIKFMAEVLNIVEGLLRGTVAVSIPGIDNKSKVRRNAKQEQLPKIMPKGKKKQNHFCECCNVYFSDFGHVFSEKHVAYANDERNYECIKDVIRTLPTMQDFLQKHSQCSTSFDVSFPLAPAEEGIEVAVINDKMIGNKTKIPVLENGVLNCVIAEVGPSEKKVEKSVIDLSSRMVDLGDKCLFTDEFAALGTLTPNMEDSEIKFEFDDCFIDPSFSKDIPPEFNDEGFKEFSQHCEKLLRDAAANFLPPCPLPAASNLVQDLPFIAETHQPGVMLPEQGVWKSDTTTSILPGASSVVPCQLNYPPTTSQLMDKPHECKIETNETIEDNFKLNVVVAEDQLKDSLTLNSPHLIQSEENCKESPCVPALEKRLFSSSDSSDEEGKRSAFIGDVLTRIHCSEDMQFKNASKKPASVKLPVKKVVSKVHGEKLKKPLCKRKLPPLWSVSIVPSKTIRLRFTCLRNSEHGDLEAPCFSANTHEPENL